MDIIYTWNINTMEVYPQHEGIENVVFNVHWTLIGEDIEKHQGSVYGATQITIDANSESFTPFEQLTKEQVVSWVENTIGAEAVEATKKAIDSQIEQQLNPTVITPPLPWMQV